MPLKALISTTNNAHEMTELDLPKGPNSQTNLVTCKVIEIPAPSNATATDQTGRFLHRSSLGNLYVMVAYVRDANAIMPSQQKTVQKQRSFLRTHKYTTDCVIKASTPSFK